MKGYTYLKPTTNRVKGEGGSVATQKQCTDYLKEWSSATSMAKAIEAASKTAKEFDGLYDESAKNLLGRTPDLILLLSAYMAGKADGIAQEKARDKTVQDTLT